jgi:cysteine desulfurase
LCDTTQFIGKTPFNFKESNIDYAVCSGHKLGAMTGAGILLARNPEKLLPLIIGGGQEKGHRGGTQNYLGNETLAVALSSLEKTFENIPALTKKREEFEKKVKDAFPEVVIIGQNAPRLATTTYISYPGIHGQAVQIELESNDIFVTTSSACSDNMPVTSKVLKAMGTCDNIGRGVVRISLCLNSPLEYYDHLAEALIKAYTKLAKVKSF